jgi:F0F1-type ATP synthase membrane subunit b/b'
MKIARLILVGAIAAPLFFATACNDGDTSDDDMQQMQEDLEQAGENAAAEAEEAGEAAAAEAEETAEEVEEAAEDATN